ncbi:MAG: ribonucleoside-diphosphate reductase, partial [Treponema sp.]|nr:ribonucleoside-diphosphate reductase [Treponema sp.]
MTIQRFFTDPASGPYKDIVWEKRRSEIRNPDGKIIFCEDTVIVPAFWSQIAGDILAQKYFRKTGIPSDKLYAWQEWAGRTPGSRTPGSRTPDSPALNDPGLELPEDGAEHDARQVFHRLAFTWLSWGRKEKIFSSGEDEKAFYDETCHMLAHQMAAPNSPQWFNTGLYAVYGINGPAQGHYYVDPATGKTEKSDSAYKRPQP